MAIPMPAPAAKRVPWVWILLTVLCAGVAFYYYHKEQTLLALIQNALNGSNNGGGNNGGNSGGGGNNGGGGNGGGGGNSGGNNGSGGGNNTQALMQQQVWQMTQWNQTGGNVVVQGTWTNNSTTTLTNGTLTCTEYDANSTQLGTLTDTLLGPIKGNMVYTFNSINMGSPAANLNKLGCALSAITQ
ncbi:MAG: FxLYD domain-containing protein [Acidobacteriaceae bacterium]